VTVLVPLPAIQSVLASRLDLPPLPWQTELQGACQQQNQSPCVKIMTKMIIRSSWDLVGTNKDCSNEAPQTNSL
jgi:hypothetical protein